MLIELLVLNIVVLLVLAALPARAVREAARPREHRREAKELLRGGGAGDSAGIGRMADGPGTGKVSDALARQGRRAASAAGTSGDRRGPGEGRVGASGGRVDRVARLRHPLAIGFAAAAAMLLAGGPATFGSPGGNGTPAGPGADLEACTAPAESGVLPPEGATPPSAIPLPPIVVPAEHVPVSVAVHFLRGV